MSLKEISGAELIQAFENAVKYLPGTGARGRSHYYEVKEELENRLGANDYDNPQAESIRRNFF